jgi:phenylpropionate dioxygenase-like ring-hydroxylating dioxygenase large terminal subunit
MNPLPENTIFNNWDVVAKGWYLVCLSQEIPKGQVKSLEICGQRIVLFRGQDGKINALDAYCPHLGTDLGIGRVDKNLIRCFFHHWAFDGQGNCQDIPCQTTIPEAAKLPAYTCEEKYGFIWIYPDENATEPLPDFDELQGKKILIKFDKALQRNCHHHICMMNGIDVQHLQTVHKIKVKMSLSLSANEAGTIIDFTLTGTLPKNTLKERIVSKILGENYQYSMRYAHGCLGLLTIMKNVRFIPPLHMIYAYNPLPSRKTRIQPIYVTEKRKGILGWITSQILILLTRLAYYYLRGEDGKIYDNIRFHPQVVLKLDRPLVKYINYVNDLEPSRWSKSFNS